MKMRYLLISLILITSPIYADICGEVSIGKSADVYKGNMKIGYDISMGDITLIPFVDYVNYFKYDNGGHPFLDVFGCGFHVEYKDLFLKVLHECSHAVSSLNSIDKPVLYSDAELNKSSTWVIIGYRWGRKM